jgi:hypothetical protein
MSREAHVRFWERAGVKLPCATHLHETLENVTAADVYSGRRQEILSRRERIKRETLTQRKRENLRAA